MPAIVTATDFSEAAANAVHYACNLAVDVQATVTVIHSFSMPVSFNEMAMPVMPLEENRKVAEESMEKLLAQLKSKYPSLSITCKVSYGEIIDALQEYIEDKRPMLVVIGNNSNEGTAFWMGSHMLAALRQLPCPVAAIPREAAYRPIKKICFACDYKQMTEKLPVERLFPIIQATGAQLHVLNVDHDNKGFAVNTPLESTIVHEMLKSVEPQYHFIDHEDIDAGIQQFIETHNMDWLLMMPHKHGFFEGLFHKSHTKAMAKMSHIPLVALHEKEN